MGYYITKKIIDWDNVVRHVNKKLCANYSRNYIMNVYNGVQKSGKIKKELDTILKG